MCWIFFLFEQLQFSQLSCKYRVNRLLNIVNEMLMSISYQGGLCNFDRILSTVVNPEYI